MVPLPAFGANEPSTEKEQAMPYSLPDLPYAYDALEPWYDEETVRLHHDKHHAGYVKGLNTALEKLDAARSSGDFSSAKPLAKELAFHGSGHVLHSIFWTNMTPDGGGEPDGALANQLQADFGSFDGFKEQFLAASNGVEGSGWGILGWHSMLEKLLVVQAEIHQNLTVQGITPLLVVDVWEHAYYLKYQNRRAEFTQAFFENLVNWADVASRLDAARG
jgi:Fe-Mn family superoxide dismutase